MDHGSREEGGSVSSPQCLGGNLAAIQFVSRGALSLLINPTFIGSLSGTTCTGFQTETFLACNEV